MDRLKMIKKIKRGRKKKEAKKDKEKQIADYWNNIIE